MTLFRQEAIDAQKIEKYGEISLSPPRIGWLFFTLASGLLMAILALGYFGRYAKTENVSGRLMPSSGQSSIFATNARGGIVTSVLVREGQIVKKGEPVIKVTLQRTSVALGDTGEIISQQLERKSADLRASIESQKNLALLREKEMKGRIEILEQRKLRFDSQIRTQEQRYSAAKDIYEVWRIKAVDVISGYQLSQQHDSVLQQQSLVESLNDQRLQVLADLAQTQAELSQLSTKTNDQISLISAQLADVQSAKAENEQTRALIIRAPNDGVVTGLLAHIGQPINDTLPLMSILPDDAKLVVELWVPNRSVGLLKAGDDVAISYDAFPSDRYGWQPGKIKSITNASISAAELTNFLGHEEKEGAYRVLVQPSVSRRNKFGSSLLKPGMTLSAKISVENRRLIEWVFKPRSETINIVD
ncbi:membrane fusion protein [Pseudoxanthomonas sp. GM95]|uniref:HlyD family efflux transporter periplasmic adaptor subunit n=1 Tax=Pseudoxanthomonas sp. GM95 TaxID=1881043 RepID=UPI0008AF4CD4|nr:HlyD family efflux transporter periplasmic adaptor subunit [Pseudoxanthomonas sp. GM95]SEL11311.1 membrane fusion protein [Pseudoxanthomonas sp. GM95]